MEELEYDITEPLLECYERRNNILNGNYNSIPIPWINRYKNDFPALEPETYYLLTSYEKNGKTQLTSNIFLYSVIEFLVNKPKDCQLDADILYFNLEESKNRIIQRYYAYCLQNYGEDNERITTSPAILRSRNNEPVSEKTLSKIKNDKVIRKYLNKFNEKVHFSLNNVKFNENKNPTGIYKICCKYAETIGKIKRKQKVYNENGEQKTVNGFDEYVPNNKFHITFVVIDHLAKIANEGNMDEKKSMDKLSSYLMELRDRYKFSPVVIQQQNQDGKSNESIKMNNSFPDTRGLYKTKETGMDCNVCLAIFNPSEFDIEEYEGYSVPLYNKHLAFLKILASRDGEKGGKIPVFFSQCNSTFEEFPSVEDSTAIREMMKRCQNLNI